MDIFSAEFVSALVAIILLDLVLAGDNALVIGLVARKVPKHQRNTLILWGTIGAIAVRATMTLGVYWLLKVPGLMLIGAVALVWIARKLMQPDETGEHGHGRGFGASSSLAGAIRTIVIADTVLGIDNALAIGATARDSILLIVLGLAITVPIIVWGSRLVVAIVGRFPSIVLLAGGVLAWTAAKMMLEDPLLAGMLARGPSAEVMLTILVFAISLSPWFEHRLKPSLRPLTVVLPCLALWLLAFEAAAELRGWEIAYLQAAEWRDAALQFVRWVGWIPLASLGLWMAERRSRRRQPVRPRVLSHR